jgi:hypothetical protein
MAWWWGNLRTEAEGFYAQGKQENPQAGFEDCPDQQV